MAQVVTGQNKERISASPINTSLQTHTPQSIQILSSRGRKQTGKHRTLLGLHWFTSPSSPFADLSSLTKVLEAKHHQGLSPFLWPCIEMDKTSVFQASASLLYLGSLGPWLDTVSRGPKEPIWDQLHLSLNLACSLLWGLNLPLKVDLHNQTD